MFCDFKSGILKVTGKLLGDAREYIMQCHSRYPFHSVFPCMVTMVQYRALCSKSFLDIV